MSPLRGALLGLIARGPKSGYDLAKIFDATLANVWSAQHSQIYPELAAMADEGLVSVRPAGSRRRKEYSLTASGRRAFSEWLTERPRARIARNEALLRCFFLGYMPLEDARELLDAEIRRHEAQLEIYVEDQASGLLDTPRGWTGRIALEAGVRYERMMIDWLNWAHAEVGKYALARPTESRGRTARTGALS